MVRATGLLLFCRKAAAGAAGNISKAVSDFLVCPLSKNPLRLCSESKSLVSDAIGVSFPIVDSIPCLVPKDGKMLDDDGFKPNGEFRAD